MDRLLEDGRFKEMKSTEPSRQRQRLWLSRRLLRTRRASHSRVSPQTFGKNMKTLFSILLIAMTIAVAEAAWPEVSYTEVRGYAFNTKGGPATIIENDKLNASVVNPEGALLTVDQTKRLIAALTEKHPDHPRARCFNPRHAFVFYDGKKHAVAVVDVCFECLEANASPRGTIFPYDFPAIADLCAELKLKDAPDKDFRTWFDEFRTNFGKHKE